MIEKEIATKIAYLLKSNGKALPKAWVIKAVLDEHRSIKKSGFSAFCEEFTVGALVLKHFRKERKKDEEENPKERMIPELEIQFALQENYAISRNGEPMIVPLTVMSDEEIDEKTDELRKMTIATAIHAD